MKKGTHLTLALVTSFFLMTYLSCGGSGGGEDVSGSPTIQTISYQPDADGFLQYSTNDPSLYYTGHYHTNNTIQTTMSSVEIQVKKIPAMRMRVMAYFFVIKIQAIFIEFSSLLTAIM